MTPFEALDAATCWELVAGFFGGDAAKTALWFDTPNPLLGQIKPNDMIKLRRTPMLLRVIREQLAENERPPQLTPPPSDTPACSPDPKT